MFELTRKSVARRAAAVAMLATTVLGLSLATFAEKKPKKKEMVVAPRKNILELIDYSKLVWPSAPAITRLKYLDLFYGEKAPDANGQKKAGWMDRLAGVATGENLGAKPRFQLLSPYGVAVDSKGRVYTADAKVGAVFIFDTKTKDVDLIKNGVNAKFGLITGLAIDDADRLFVADSQMKRVLIFNPEHKIEGGIAAGISSPAGLAIDNENRFLYVCDTDLDQVLVYNADPPYKLIRKMGTAGKEHTLTEAGQFAVPTNVAVDSDGNLYVSDTFNDRVEVFDAEGNFIRTFGKPGDGPGYFARPKGLAVDSDGHVWVADAMQDRLQVFDKEGRLLMWMGGHGALPGLFSDIAGVAIDKENRIFTSEQYPGRLQMFRYFTDDEARAEKARRDAEEKKKGDAPTTSAAKEKDSAVH